MKKRIALLLCLVLLLSLASCGQKSQPSDERVEEVVEVQEPEMNGAPDDDPTWMLDLMEKNADLWLAEDTPEQYTTYSVTDWDHNGLLEINATTYLMQEDRYTQRTYEAAVDRSGLVAIEQEESGSYPAYDALECYSDEETYYYVYGVLSPVEYQTDNYEENVYAMFKTPDGKMALKWLGTLKGVYNAVEESFEPELYGVDGSRMDGDPMTQLIPQLLGTSEHCTAIRFAVHPEWYEGDIQTMLGASLNGWYQELPSGEWFELAMYTDPNDSSWEDAANPEVIQSSLLASGLDVPVRIIPSEDVTVTLQVGDWTFLPFEFHGQEAFTQTLKAGQAYEFMVPMGEVLPLARLHATSGPGEDVFYDFAMDGSGEAPVTFHLQPDVPDLLDVDDSFVELCIAYAGIAAKYEDHYSVEPQHFWEAAVNGITRYAMRWSDPDSEGNIYLDQEALDRFTDILCPAPEVPELKDAEGIAYQNGEYVVSATFDEVLDGAYMNGMGLDGDESSGKVVVILPALGDIDVEVSFQRAIDWQEHPDTPWVITGARFAYG